MKKFNLLMVFALRVVTLHAQEIKIGYANVDYIFNKLPEVKRIESDLKVLQTNLESRIETNYFDFQKKLTNYKTQYNDMTLQVRLNKEKELAELQAMIDKMAKDAETTFQKKQNELLQPVYAQIDRAIQDVAKENQFSLILSDRIADDDVVLYAEERLDISKLVLKKLGINE